MIPKIIHYCWFGNGPKDELTLKCIGSWKKMCPDYEIIEWNEFNSNLSNNCFAKEAFENKKWAFVSDYVRLVKLYEYGGIYLDTDVELIKGLNDFLGDNTFFGYAEDTCIGSSTIGAEKGSQFIKELLGYYSERHFIKANGVYDDIPNNIIITKIAASKFGFKPGNNMVGKDTKIYPTSYFSPFRKSIIGNTKRLYSHKNFIVDDSVYAIHYNSLSWIDVSLIVIITRFAKQILRTILPHRVFWKVKSYLFWRRFRDNWE